MRMREDVSQQRIFILLTARASVAGRVKGNLIGATAILSNRSYLLNWSTLSAGRCPALREAEQCENGEAIGSSRWQRE